MKRFNSLGIACACMCLAALSLGDNGHAQEQDKHGSDLGKPYAPVIKIEAALTAAQAALVKEKFNPAAFEVHDVVYYDKLPVDWESASRLAHNANHSGSAQLLELRKAFGEGPAWIANYWRTARVSHSGDWWDGARFALSVVIYGEKKVAIIDGRTVQNPGDKTN